MSTYPSTAFFIEVKDTDNVEELDSLVVKPPGSVDDSLHAVGDLAVPANEGGRDSFRQLELERIGVMSHRNLGLTSTS